MKSKTCVSTANTTIAAVATPPGNSGVGIVRLSGPRAYDIARGLINRDLLPRHATLVEIAPVRDTAIAIYFKAPHSFTGEDVVELQCHGGQLLLDKVLQAVISNGAELAQAGEFSRRAFMNGKMSLAEAESVINMINAQSDAELTASGAFFGEFGARLRDIETELTQIRAQIEAAIDYPEDTPLRAFNAQIRGLVKKIRAFTDNVNTANYIFNGIKVAILGRTNVGKSSIFNALLGTDRSIVTQTPGTTTDTVTESVQIGGYRIRFIDTAGFRDNHGEIEKLGIERSRRALAQCDIALCVFESEQDDEILDLVKAKPHIIVFNKSDIKTGKKRTAKDPNTVYASAKTGENIDTIKKLIIQKTAGMSANVQSGAVANLRQIGEFNAAAVALESAMASESAEIVASGVQTAAFHIGNITGTNASEAVLDEIFSRFCLGK